MSASRRTFLRTAGALAGSYLFVGLRPGAIARARAAERRAAGREPDELAADESFWRDIQQAFDVDRSIVNLNNGGVSPTPRVVLDAFKRYLDFSNHAPAKTMWDILEPQTESVRRHLARAFGCDAEEMAITRNASESLENCLFGIDLKRGDEILTTDQDYPRMLNAIKQRVRREGVVLKTFRIPVPVRTHEELVSLYEQNRTPRTRLILVCHVNNLIGEIFPVKSICALARRFDIPCIVDGAHAFAQFPFRRDELDCDYYGTSLHKWLTAPVGSGFLYVRREQIKALWPLMAAEEKQDADIRKFEEIGTHPAAHRLAIAEALAFHRSLGPARKAARLRYLRNAWALRLARHERVRLLTNLDPQRSCALGTFAIDGIEPAKLTTHLWEKRRILATPIDHADVKGVRVTASVYTSIEEVEMFVEAVEQVLRSGLPA